MPKIENAMCSRSDKAGTENNIRPPGQDRFEQKRVFFGIVFQISILNDHDGRGGMADACSDGSALAAIYGM